jgi:hypothetical protein
MVDDGCNSEGCSGDPNLTIHTRYMGGFPAVIAPNATSLGTRAEEGYSPDNLPDPSGPASLISDNMNVGLNRMYLYHENEIFAFANYIDGSNGDISVTSITIWNKSNSDVSLSNVDFSANPSSCQSSPCFNGPSYNYSAVPPRIGTANSGLGIVNSHNSGEISLIPSGTSNQRNLFNQDYSTKITASFSYYSSFMDTTAWYRMLSTTIP